MFERMIAATDLSPASFAVVAALRGLRAYGARHCLLLQCISPLAAASAAFSYQTDPFEAMLREQESIVLEQGFTVESRTVVGSPKQEVNRLAVEEGYSLIVVGTQGHSLLGQRLLGGVAYGIMSNAQKPVLAVPVEKSPHEEQACEPVGRCDFADHVLFATDFSENADHAFSHVEQMVSSGARRVTLLHVQDKTKLEPHLRERLEEFNQIDQERLEVMKQALLQGGPPVVDTEVCWGVPYAEITRVARDRDVQLVVMGTQGRGFVAEILLGSVSHNVVRHSVAPVLLIPVAER